MPGQKYRSIKNPRVYEALREKGYSKEKAARISNAQTRKRRRMTSTERSVYRALKRKKQ